MKSLTGFLSEEIAHSASGHPPAEFSSEAKAYVARVVKSDARMASAYAHSTSSMDPLQKIRSFLKSGELDLARNCLDSLDVSQFSNEEFTEIFLEETRLAVFRGEWTKALEISEQALARGVSSVSLLTFRQVRAVAFLEVGAFTQAHAELKLASSLLRLFPHAGLALYVAATEVKLLVAEGEFDEAKGRLRKAWRALLTGNDLNADNCLALIRSEMELARQSAGDWRPLAFATWLIAKATGDQLYQSIAALDIYMGLNESEQHLWMKEFEAAKDQYVRLSKLAAEINECNSSSTSAKFLRTARDSKSVDTSLFTPADASEIRTLLAVNLGLKINLETLEVTAMPLPKQLQRALLLLAEGPLTTEKFFQRLWQHPKFVPHLHASGVRSLLHRLRKNYGIESVTEEGYICLPLTRIIK
jgi:tetratricopeptide (TPR) repeat protein